MKIDRFILIFSVLFSMLFIQNRNAFSQVKIEGTVVEYNNRPVPYASIKLQDHADGIVTDTSGNFLLHVRSLKPTDTLVITSVGYEIFKIPAAKTLKKRSYQLTAYSKKMDAVVVKAFSKEDIAGAQTDKVGYYRGWNTDNRGGEIGRSIYVPHKEYQVSKVRFKIFTSCDTCTIRLHIRDIKSNGEPGRDLLDSNSNTVQTFYNAAVADKTYDFDLLSRNIILHEKSIFVGFEVLKASSNGKDCSLSFVGSEPGVYIYKSDSWDNWNFTDYYTIHLKVFFRYD